MKSWGKKGNVKELLTQLRCTVKTLTLKYMHFRTYVRTVNKTYTLLQILNGCDLDVLLPILFIVVWDAFFHYSPLHSTPLLPFCTLEFSFYSVFLIFKWLAEAAVWFYFLAKYLKNRRKPIQTKPDWSWIRIWKIELGDKNIIFTSLVSVQS